MDKRKPKEQKAKERKESIETAYDVCTADGKVTVSDLAEYLGVTEKTVRNRLKEHGGFVIDDSEVRKKHKISLSLREEKNIMDVIFSKEKNIQKTLFSLGKK